MPSFRFAMPTSPRCLPAPQSAPPACAARPDLSARLLRGNVETRLAKLDRGEYDAVVLAVAGLVRLGLAGRIRARLPVEQLLPAPGQGALGIECLASAADVMALLAPLADADTSACVRAERVVSRSLGGSCTVPLGAYAEANGSELRLRALVASPDGKRVARVDLRGPAADAERLGERAADELRHQGAAEILASLG
jgi:hydroxymethylbilane synthase